MPNWSDGEGGCGCPSGKQAGLGHHREGEPGCGAGPAASVGVPAEERRRRALVAHLATVPKELRQVAARAFVAGWEGCAAGK